MAAAAVLYAPLFWSNTPEFAASTKRVLIAQSICGPVMVIALEWLGRRHRRFWLCELAWQGAVAWFVFFAFPYYFETP